MTFFFSLYYYNTVYVIGRYFYSVKKKSGRKYLNNKRNALGFREKSKYFYLWSYRYGLLRYIIFFYIISPPPRLLFHIFLLNEFSFTLSLSLSVSSDFTMYIFFLNNIYAVYTLCAVQRYRTYTANVFKCTSSPAISIRYTRTNCAQSKKFY